MGNKDSRGTALISRESQKDSKSRGPKAETTPGQRAKNLLSGDMTVDMLGSSRSDKDWT